MNIKNCYETPNSPYKNSESKKRNSDGTKSKMLGITVGPEMFEAMMKSYKNSMKRKRGQNFK
jgi:membrane protease subunit (stomatin/prohibitin family)